MALTLIREGDDYNVYEDEYGDEVLLAGIGPLFRRVVLWEDFDVTEAWSEAVDTLRQTNSWGLPDRDAFVAKVRLAVAEPDSVDIVWCESCQEATREDSAESVNHGAEYACSSCYEENYYGCSDCGTMVHSDDTSMTLHDESICNRCLEGNYAWCDECDGYYHSNYEGDHRHGECDCASPAQTFTMRNDGEPVLNQDERVTIALPSGVISSEGIQSIVGLIRSHGFNLPLPDEGWTAGRYDEQEKWLSLARELEGSLGDQWQTKEGNYTKRLSKLAHKSQGLKIPPALLSQVGCIARDNSTGVDFAIEVTRNLNLPAEDFYHDDSCWWQSYSESRCALKTNGGIGMRTFNEDGYVQGRAWIMPLRLNEDGVLRATFDSLTRDAFMVFNGYGDLSGYTPARIVAHMAGMTYRKISFDCSPMYVNNSNGYLVASEEIAAKYAKEGLSLYVDTHSLLYHDETRSLCHAA